MGFTQNNNFNGANQNNGSDGKKVNFPVGRIWGSDGQMNISIWVADNGVKTILAIKQSVGNDPTTGAPTYEQRKPSELPRFFMNLDLVTALLTVLEDQSKDPGSCNIVIDRSQNNGGKLTIVGNGSSIKFTIDGAKNGSRSMTVNSIAVGSTNIHSGYKNFTDYMKIAHKKALLQKLDPEAFGMAIKSVTSSDEDDGDVPF